MRHIKYLALLACIGCAGSNYILHSAWTGGRAVPPFTYSNADSSINSHIHDSMVVERGFDSVSAKGLIHDSLSVLSFTDSVNIGITGTTSGGVIQNSRSLFGNLTNVSLTQGPVGNNVNYGIYTTVLGKSVFDSAGDYNFLVGKDDTLRGSSYTAVFGIRNKIYPFSPYSFISGIDNSIYANTSHVEGSFNTDSVGAFRAHIEGAGNTIAGYCGDCHAEGLGNTLKGTQNNISHIEGSNNIGYASVSHVEGSRNLDSGLSLGRNHIEGDTNKNYGSTAHLEGAMNRNFGLYRNHLEGLGNKAYSSSSHLEGSTNVDSVNASESHLEGTWNTLAGYCISCHAEGVSNVLKGSANSNSHVEGSNNVGYSPVTHLEGESNLDSNTTGYNHSEGFFNQNRGVYAHIEGWNNKNYSDSGAHVEGYFNVDSASHSHVEGDSNVVWSSARNSHTEGYRNNTKGSYSHNSGVNNTTYYGQTVIGKYSVDDASSVNAPTANQNVFKVGWGVAGTPKDVFKVSDSGNITSFNLRGSGRRLLVADSGGKITVTTGVGDTIDNGYIVSLVDSSNGVSLVDSVEKTITSLNLPAGDWDVSAVATISGVNSPYVNTLGASISTTANTMMSNGTEVYSIVGGGSLIPGKYGRVSAPIPPIKFRSTTSQTVYLVTFAVWVGGTSVTAFGRISARRWN